MGFQRAPTKRPFGPRREFFDFEFWGSAPSPLYDKIENVQAQEGRSPSDVGGGYGTMGINVDRTSASVSFALENPAIIRYNKTRDQRPEL
jgi:hypothetical protein